jgi:hypothetical protein
MKYTSDKDLPEITEQTFQETLQKSKPYTVLILKTGPNFQAGANRSPSVAATVKEHGKRTMALRTAGILPVVCPIGDGSKRESASSTLARRMWSGSTLRILASRLACSSLKYIPAAVSRAAPCRDAPPAA